MVEEILALKEKGYTIKQIAKEMDSTVGKIQYRLRKQQTVERTRASQKNPPTDNSRVHPTMNIPPEYDVDRVVLLPQGPGCIFVYWDVRSSTRNMVSHHFAKPWTELKKTLKVYDVSDLIFNGHDSHRYFDISLPEMTDNWFINDLEENRTYIIDFGIQPDSGGFFTVLRSAPVETPRTTGGSKRHSEAVDRWKSGEGQKPDWYEQFSTYSIYSLLK